MENANADECEFYISPCIKELFRIRMAEMRTYNKMTTSVSKVPRKITLRFAA